MVVGAHVIQEIVDDPMLPAARVKGGLVFGFAFALLLAHAPAPRMPGCVEVVSPFRSQPLH
eukprot:3611238-Pyramimonas_sp.AAC.1